MVETIGSICIFGELGNEDFLKFPISCIHTFQGMEDVVYSQSFTNSVD